MTRLVLTTCLAFGLAACGSSRDAMTDGPRAMVQITPTSAQGSDVRGDLSFAQTDGALRVTGTIRGLTPGSAHGFHLHRDGACGEADSDNDGQMEPGGAAGPHWDPLNTNDHEGPDDPFQSRHAGDLGNISAGADGVARIDMTLDNLSVSGQYGVVGRSVMVHADRDDLQSDPGGAAGTRVGCGVISMMN